jgi:ethanolamine ammonia-lyase small subunit
MDDFRGLQCRFNADFEERSRARPEIRGLILDIQMDAWNQLRGLTTARIALGRSGGSLPTRERLDFLLAHARARDAVVSVFDAEEFAARLRVLMPGVLVVNSAAGDRAEFLRRPDLGRRLAAESRKGVSEAASDLAPFDLAIIVSDGLSTQAVATQCEPLLAALLPLARGSGWTLAPVIVARHGRVALQDEIGALLKARLSVMLLGERPGLGSADSLGVYFTYGPAPGRTDADRNCISNIREGGLTAGIAAAKLHGLLARAFQLGLSGVRLKDDAAVLPGPGQATSDRAIK